MTNSRNVKKTQKRKSFSKKAGKANSKRAGGSRKASKKTSKKNNKKQLKRNQMGMGGKISKECLVSNHSDCNIPNDCKCDCH
jgi:hypothetical protein